MRVTLDLKIDSSIIVPAFNEEETVENFITHLKAALEGVKTSYEIIVIDDGSSDNTYSILSAIPDVKTVRHQYNKGNGASVKSGIFEAVGENIIVIDADSMIPCIYLR